MTEQAPDPTTQAEASDEPTPPPAEPAPDEPTPDAEPEPEQDPPATQPGAEPQEAPPSPVGGNPDPGIPQPEADEVIYVPGEEPEEPGEAVIATLTPEQGLAGTNDQAVLIYGENLHLLKNWHLETQAPMPTPSTEDEGYPVVVEVVDENRANVTIPLSAFPTDTDETITLVGETEDGEEVAAEFIVEPFLNEDGEPVTDQVFGQTVEVNPNPLRLEQAPPVTPTT
jgi:hypothetical protein